MDESKESARLKLQEALDAITERLKSVEDCLNYLKTPDYSISKLVGYINTKIRVVKSECANDPGCQYKNRGHSQFDYHGTTHQEVQQRAIKLLQKITSFCASLRKISEADVLLETLYQEYNAPANLDQQRIKI